MDPNVDDAGRGERCLLCRRPLGGGDGGDTCPECAEAVEAYLTTHRLTPSHADLAIKHLWEIGCATNRYGRPESHRPESELLLRVPTYYGAANTQHEDLAIHEDFDKPFIPVLVHNADGVRVVLGSHDFEDLSFPDVQIERRPHGWALFLHPIGGGDPSGYVYFLDDGRSYVQPESPFSSTPPIQAGAHKDDFSEIDSIDEDASAG